MLSPSKHGSEFFSSLLRNPAEPAPIAARVREHARRAEALGYDGLVVPEVVNDAMMVSLLALEHTERVHVTTGVVIAFAISPMLLARQAQALRQVSGGRR